MHKKNRTVNRPPWQPSWQRRMLPPLVFLLLVAALVALVITYLQRAQPPSSFKIVTGLPGTASYLAAKNYQRIAKENDFELDIVSSDDIEERIQLLLSGEAQAGFVPSGGAAGLQTDKLRTLASVYYEPIWIFYRRALAPEHTFTDPADLRGLRVALGPGSQSTERLARLLLEENGINEQNTTFIELEQSEAARRLGDGTLDAAFFTGAATEDIVLPLLRNPALDIINVRRADAYASRYRFLTTLILPEGMINLQNNLPSEEKRLLSVVANIVIRHDLHPDLIRLMTIAVVETHEQGGLFEGSYEFPKIVSSDLPISREYLAYLEQIRGGESQLDNIFPFRIAALIDRLYLFAVPVLLLLIPVILRSPSVFAGFMRRRLWSWYQLLRDIEKRAMRMDGAQIELAEEALDEMERRLEQRFSIWRGYLAGYYDLRMHIALVRGKLRARREVVESGVMADSLQSQESLATGSGD